MDFFYRPSNSSPHSEGQIEERKAAAACRTDNYSKEQTGPASSPRNMYFWSAKSPAHEVPKSS